MPLSAAAPDKKFVEVMGRRLAYVEMGEGPPIVFQHGNPTSSYLWRNVMPHVAHLGRCIAVDLLGMGDSSRLPGHEAGRYSFAAHKEHLWAAWEALGVSRDVVLVLHDWGGALGFDWARHHADAVQGLAFMETIVSPIPTWDDWPEAARAIFQALRSEAGEEMILEKNVFVERILPASIIRDLKEAEMEEYRRPFRAKGEARRPTLDWPRQIPIAGEPRRVAKIVAQYADWLRTSPIPKLFIDAEPGSITIGKARAFARALPMTEVEVVKGLHFIQEDSPDEIGAALARFVGGLRG